MIDKMKKFIILGDSWASLYHWCKKHKFDIRVDVLPVYNIDSANSVLSYEIDGVIKTESWIYVPTENQNVIMNDVMKRVVRL